MRGKTIKFKEDRPPKEIPNLEEKDDLLLQKYVHGTELNLVKKQEAPLLTVVAFVNRYKITSLKLGGLYEGYFLGDKAAILLAQIPTLTDLGVAYNEISLLGARALAENTTLTALDFEGQQDGDEEPKNIVAIVKAFAKNTTLFRLSLGYSALGDDSAIILSSNTTLRELNVTCNNITDTGLAALLKTKLTKIFIDPRAIGTLSMQAFAANRRLIYCGMGSQNQEMLDSLVLQKRLTIIEDRMSRNRRLRVAWRQAAYLLCAERAARSTKFPPLDSLYKEVDEFLGPDEGCVESDSSLREFNSGTFPQLQFFRNLNRRPPSLELEQKEKDVEETRWCVLM